MREYLLQLKTQGIELWQRTTRAQKVVISVSAVLLVATLILMVRGASRPDYGALFTQMDEAGAAQAVEKLKEMKIPYKVEITGEGTTILIPSKDIPETRLTMVKENIATGGVVGFEDFNQTKFGETDTDRRARYLRALQGELTRTIERLTEVDKARVHIVLPEPSLFKDEQKNATAAIMLKLKPYKSLDVAQVQGIVKLVSSSVEGLKPENVTVVDDAGNVISEDLGLDQEGAKQKLTTTQLGIQEQYQKKLQNSVQTMLEKVVGMGKAVVRVQADLDFDKIKRSTKEVKDPVIISRSTKKESASSTNSSTAEDLGTDGNTPGYVSPDSNSTSESESKEEIENYEITTTLTDIEQAPGSVKKMSVAVVIDKELNDKQRQQITDIVKSASGYEQARGDQISVLGMPFNTEYQDEMNAAMAKADKQKMLTYGGVAAVALLVLGAVAYSVSRKRKQSLAEEAAAFEGEVVQLGEPVPVKDFLEEYEEYKESKKKEHGQLTPEEMEKLRIKEEVEKVANENPADVANLLKSWLAEE
ncbi:MAG: flagellar basal-body MS-ring/collar protein FliF [Bacillota bacterium]